MAGPDGTPDAEAPVPGPVEAATRADVEALVSGHPMGEALAAIAFSHARALDAGAGMAQAAIGKDLRATLVELARLGDDGDDDLEAELSAAVRDEEDAEPGDAGSGAGPDSPAAG